MLLAFRAVASNALQNRTNYNGIRAPLLPRPNVRGETHAHVYQKEDSAGHQAERFERVRGVDPSHVRIQLQHEKGSLHCLVMGQDPSTVKLHQAPPTRCRALVSPAWHFTRLFHRGVPLRSPMPFGSQPGLLTRPTLFGAFATLAAWNPYLVPHPLPPRFVAT